MRILNSVLSVAIAVAPMSAAAAETPNYYFRYTGSVGSTAAVIVEPDVADQQDIVLGRQGAAIQEWRPTVPSGWAAVVVEKDSRRGLSSGVSFSASHDLSAYGLIFDATAGAISGIPTQAFDIADFALTAHFGDRSDSTRPFRISVEAREPGETITLAVAPEQKTLYKVRLGSNLLTDPIVVTNAEGPVTFERPIGPVNYDWSTMDGVLYGVAGPEGPRAFDVSMADDKGNTGSFAFSVEAIADLYAGADMVADIRGAQSYNGNPVIRKPNARNIIGTAQWAISGLPDGLAFDPASGEITGEVTDSALQGTHAVNLSLTDPHDGQQDSATLTVNVLPPFDVFDFTGMVTNVGDQIVPSGFNVRSIGNQPYTQYPLTFTKISGDLPPGISTSAVGELFTFSGAATAEGIFESTWKVTDSRGWSRDLGTVTFDVRPSTALTITGLSDSSLAADKATTAATPEFAPSLTNLEGTAQWSAAGLPDGMSIDTATGKIFGEVTSSSEEGDHLVTVSVTDASNGKTASQPFTLTVVNPLRDTGLVTVQLKQRQILNDDGFNIRTRFNTPYNVATLTFEKVSGDLPPGVGVAVDGNVLKFTGNATVVGTYTSAWKVTDSRGWTKNLAPIDVTVVPGQALEVAAVQPVTAYGDTAYTAGQSLAVFVAANVGGTVAWSASGLPDGLSVDAQTGRVVGTITNPNAAGSYTATVTATDSIDNSTASQPLAVEVIKPIKPSDTNVYPGAIVKQYSAMQAGTIQIRSEKDNAPYNSPMTLELVSGTLPAGVSATVTGSFVVFSGTPTQQGTFTVEYDVKTASGWATRLPAVTFVVEPREAAKINGATAVEAAGETTYTNAVPLLQLTAADVMGTAQWAASGLPTGLAINPTTGAITGTVTSASAVGLYTATVTLTDSFDNSTATATVPVTVTSALTYSKNLVYGGATLDQYGTMTVGTFDIINKATSAAASGTLSVSKISGDLPAGISISVSGSQVRFSGAPTVQGTFTTQYQVTASTGWTVLLPPVTFVVNPRAAIVIGSLGSMTAVGEAVYTTASPIRQLTASNIIGTATWSATGLPTGLSIEASTGRIIGTVTQSTFQGANQFSVTVTDSFDGASTTTPATLTVNAPFTTLGYTGATITQNVAMSGTGFNVRGAGNVPYRNKGLSAQLVSGSVPTGVSQSVTTGSELVVFTGTPTSAVGAYTSTWRITDANGWTYTPPAITFTVQTAPVLQVTSATDASILGNTAYTTTPVRQFTATGLTGTASYTATGLPTGLSMTSAGRVTGTVTTGALQGTHFVTITVRDNGNNQTSSTLWKLTINPPFSLFGYSGGTGKVGSSITPQGYNFRDLATSGPYQNKGQKGTMISGTFPPNLTVTNPVGTEFVTFSGVPTVAGVYKSVWRLEDASGFFIIAPEITLTINP